MSSELKQQEYNLEYASSGTFEESISYTSDVEINATLPDIGMFNRGKFKSIKDSKSSSSDRITKNHNFYQHRKLLITKVDSISDLLKQDGDEDKIRDLSLLLWNLDDHLNEIWKHRELYNEYYTDILNYTQLVISKLHLESQCIEAESIHLIGAICTIVKDYICFGSASEKERSLVVDCLFENGISPFDLVTE